MNANDYYKNTLEKKQIINQSLYILGTCDYDYYSNKTFSCEQQMKDLQKKWKTIGSAGNQQERLWEQFQYIQDKFWKRIKLMRKEMQLLEMSDRLGALRDDFETAEYLGRWNKAEYLSERIEEKEDKLLDLEYEISQLKEELGIKR